MLQKLNWKFMFGVGAAIAVAIALMVVVSRDVELEPVSPLAVNTARPTPEVDEGSVAVTWDQYVVLTYTSDIPIDDPDWDPSIYMPDWELYTDVELRRGEQVVLTQTIATG